MDDIPHSTRSGNLERRDDLEIDAASFAGVRWDGMVDRSFTHYKGGGGGKATREVHRTRFATRRLLPQRTEAEGGDRPALPAAVACARPGGRLSGKKSLPRVPRQPILDAAFPKRSVIKTSYVCTAGAGWRAASQAEWPRSWRFGSWKPPGSGWNSKLERLEANTLTKTLP